MAKYEEEILSGVTILGCDKRELLEDLDTIITKGVLGEDYRAWAHGSEPGLGYELKPPAARGRTLTEIDLSGWPENAPTIHIVGVRLPGWREIERYAVQFRVEQIQGGGLSLARRENGGPALVHFECPDDVRDLGTNIRLREPPKYDAKV